jgi:methylenetetrahydrofolate reductase (NADPH)
MVEEIRNFGPPCQAGVTARLGPVPSYKREADFVFVQVSFSIEALLRWRDSVDLSIPVYPGVLVLASSSMAKSVSETVPGVEVPVDLADRLEQDRSAGVEAACELVVELQRSGAFEGVHLVPVGRYREVAARLEEALSQR